MSKDPAFLFYTSDFLTGTIFMSNEQIGIYVKLLCYQHQHGGLVDKITFESMVGNNDILRKKFIESEHGYYNERLTIEVEKRERKSSNMSEIAKEVWRQRKYKSNKNVSKNDTKVNKSNTKKILSEDENENENTNENTDTNTGVVGIKKRQSNSGVKRVLPPKKIDDPFGGALLKWHDWKTYKRKEHRFSYKSSESENQALKNLHELSNGNISVAEKIIEQSIGNGWQGLFKLKNQTNGQYPKKEKDQSGGFNTGIKNQDVYDKMK